MTIAKNINQHNSNTSVTATIVALWFIIFCVTVIHTKAQAAPPSLQPTAKSVQSISTPSIPSHAVVLLYHHVSNTTPAITSISPEVFEQQLQFIEDNHFQVWPLDKIVSYLKTGAKIPDKTVAITFDDSYHSVFTEAFPRLQRRQWPFTIFVSTQAIDQQFAQQTSWQELKIMAANGATIANHSSTHKHLLIKQNNETDQQWEKRISDDIMQAQQRIQQKIGISSQQFAYPFGEYNQTLKRIVAQLGFTGWGQQSGVIGISSDQLALPRYPIAGNYTKMQDFVVKLMSLPLPVDIVSAQKNPLDHQYSKPALTLNIDRRYHSLHCFGSGQGELLLQWHKQDEYKQRSYIVTIRPKKDIPVGRSRYNCTVLGPDNRFYWYSHGWIRLKKNNQWVME